jgi:Fe-S oxidoreductase
MSAMMFGMIALLLAGMGLFTYSMSIKVAVMTGAGKENRFDNMRARIDRVLVYMFGQKRMFKEPKSGIMHAVIFYGFCILGVRTISLFLMAFSSDGYDFHLPGMGDTFMGATYGFSKDIFELLVLIMAVAAIIRRRYYRPARLTPSGEAQLILGFIITLMLTDFLFDGARFMPEVQAGVLGHEALVSPVSTAFSSIYLSLGISYDTAMTVATFSYWIHCATILAFLNLLPHSKHFHIITVFFNILFSKISPAGAIRPIENIEEQEFFGVSKVEQFSWKQIMDVYSCTECGRCEVNCPAWHTGKPLSPKVLIKDILENVHAHEKRIAGPMGLIGQGLNKLRKKEVVHELDPFEPVVPDLITQVNEDVIWACTTCRSCEENCPLLITHVDKIIDMRRNLVLMESRFPKELGPALKNLETKSNPWGLPMGERMAWAEGLNVPVMEENPDAEYVFFVGCAGCYDDRSKKVSRSVVQILQAANCDFAILGKEEGCTGDPARRIGNEYLFQLQAEQNIETFKKYDVRKVITTCPHCFNTIKNEYPQLGGNYEVWHYTDLVFQFLEDGRLKPKRDLDLSTHRAAGTDAAKRITYHDSCYLGRYNGIYDAPRETIDALPGMTRVEMEQSRENGFCCGAGGARWLMEENIGSRVNQERVRQALEVKPDIIATACPYCTMMVEDGVREMGHEDSVHVADIAELVVNAL